MEVKSNNGETKVSDVKRISFHLGVCTAFLLVTSVLCLVTVLLVGSIT